MDEKLKKNLLSESVWLRGLYMLLFYAISSIMIMLLVFIAGVQWILTLVTTKPNKNLHTFTAGGNNYLYQIFKFLTFNAEEKPFPFSDWPSSKGNAEQLTSKNDLPKGDD